MNSPVTREVERRLAVERENRGDGDLLEFWPHDPYRFGDELAAAAKALIVTTSPLREDRSFIQDVMEAILARARKQGVVFKPEVDVIVLDSGAAHVTDHVAGWGRRWQSEAPSDAGAS